MTSPDDRHLDEGTLDRYRTGELGPAERERVAAHLAACEACAVELAGLEALADAAARGYAARRTPAEEPDWARQRAAIVARTSGRPARREAGRWRWAPQAAVVVAALVVVGVLVERGIEGPEEAERFRRAAEPAAPAPMDEAPEGALSTPDAVPPAGPPADGREADADRAPAPAPAAAEAPADRLAAQAAPEAPGVEREAAARKAAEPAPENAKAQPRDDVRFRREAADEEDLETRQEPSAFSRFLNVGYQALAEEDSAAAARALSLWRDSLDPTETHPDRRRTAQALADSLEAFLDSSESRARGGPPE